jgi:hypothetical protein
MVLFWAAGLAALIAIGFGVHHKLTTPSGVVDDSPAVYVIGDLHGDAVSFCGLSMTV